MSENFRPVVLASRSAVRRRLLDHADVPFVVCGSTADESAVIAEGLAHGLAPAAIATEVAVHKAAEVVGAPSGAAVLAADQLLVFDGVILRKVASRDEALERLRSLSGGPHDLVTGAVLMIDGLVRWRWVETIRVTMRAASDAAIERYVDGVGARLFDSVACYEIEAGGAQLMERLEGDYFSALGLPLFPVLAALRDQGALPA